MPAPYKRLMHGDWVGLEDIILDLYRILNADTTLLDLITPPGSDGEVVYNNDGVYGADSTFNFNDSTKALTAQVLKITSVAASSVDTDKFLVDDSDEIKFRTGAELLSDIGASASGHDHDATYQPLDAELTSLAALSYAAASFIKMTGANTFALRTIGETADDLEGTIDHNQLANGGAHDYSYISGNDGATDVTAAQLEELTDASETTLHSHAGVGAHTHDGDTLQHDGINSDGGAFGFTTSGAVTFSQNILTTGATVTNCAVLGSNSAVFQPNADSTTFMEIKDDNGDNFVVVDSTNHLVGIGADIGTPSTDGVLHIREDQSNYTRILLENRDVGVGSGTNLRFIGPAGAAVAANFFDNAGNFYDIRAQPANSTLRLGAGNLIYATLSATGRLTLSGGSDTQSVLHLNRNWDGYTRLLIENQNTGASGKGTNLRFVGPSGTVMAGNWFDNFQNIYRINAQNIGASLHLGTEVTDYWQMTSTGAIQLLTAQNAITGSNVDVSELTYKIRNAANDNGEALGIGFALSNSANNVGAAIIHEREGSESYGKLHFATKESGQGDGADIAIRMTIDDNGNLGLNELSPETLLELTHVTPTITTHCDTHTDSADARASTWQAFGEQSGGEETTLGKQVFAHDGAADDEKGYWDLYTNDGSDGDSPTKQMRIQSTGNWVINKTSGVGLKVDLAAPTFGWRDLEGFEIPDPTGGDRPTLSTYSGGLIKENAFSNGDVLRIRYHIPHDYVKGTDILSHIHWSHNGTAISGNVVFGVTSDYAKGHNQANFGTEKSISITYATTDISTTPRYRHRIEESAITNDGGSATLIDRGLLEPDGIILITFEVTTNPTITGGSPNNVFVHRADLHYQSTNLATKQKAPDFYT